MKVTIKLKSYQRKDKTAVGKLFVRVRNAQAKTDSLISTGINVNPEFWDGNIPGYRLNTPSEFMSTTDVVRFNERLNQLILCVQENCTEVSLKSEIERTVEVFLKSSAEVKPKKWRKTQQTRSIVESVKEDIKKEQVNRLPTVIDYFKKYLDEKQLNSWHHQAQSAVMHKLERYQAWQAFVAEQEELPLYLSDFNYEEMERYYEYISHESEYRDAYPDFYKQFNLMKDYDIRPLSKNALSVGIQRLKMFLNWCVEKGYLKDLSFRRFEDGGQVYGVPYYLTVEERDYLMDFDFSDFPRLQLHRDKFVFQCLIGCRCDDLDRLTWDNINGDFIEFIPHKNLMNKRTEIVRFPITDKMRIILERQDPNVSTLFFNYCQDTYRVDIKEVLRRAGITRMVTVLDAKTRKGIQRPICDIAASHLARRTFVANLYNKVKDPNLISSLTGHVDDSKAFARYRVITDDTKKGLIDAMED